MTNLTEKAVSILAGIALGIVAIAVALSAEPKSLLSDEEMAELYENGSTVGGFVVPPEWRAAHLRVEERRAAEARGKLPPIPISDGGIYHQRNGCPIFIVYRSQQFEKWPQWSETKFEGNYRTDNCQGSSTGYWTFDGRSFNWRYDIVEKLADYHGEWGKPLADFMKSWEPSR